MPNAGKAEISPAKLKLYLLSREHPVGRFKAAFFVGLGFTADQWRLLETLLLELALGEAIQAGSTPYGEKYRIRGTLIGPTGEAVVDTVWILPSGTERPQFVTAYPSE